MDEQQRVSSESTNEAEENSTGLPWVSVVEVERMTLVVKVAVHLFPAERCTEISPKKPQTQQDYEDLIYLLGGKTQWLHIESQD